MNEASQNLQSVQPEKPEQIQATRATELFDNVRELAERRAELAAEIDSGTATEEVRESLADLDHVLLGARVALIEKEGTAGAKPADK